MKSVSKLVNNFYGGKEAMWLTANIAPVEHVFGMSRMYCVLTSDSENVMVFRDSVEAIRWLKLGSITLAELHGENSRKK
jgi:hypothetical protein